MNDQMVNGKMTNRKALALLLDPEKADLNVLPITSEVHPDYIFVGGSTGGDTTAFVRALKEYLTAQRSGSHLAAVLQAKPVMTGDRPSFFFPEIRHSLHRKQMPFFSSLCSLETTPNILSVSRLSLHVQYTIRK